MTKADVIRSLILVYLLFAIVMWQPINFSSPSYCVLDQSLPTTIIVLHFSILYAINYEQHFMLSLQGLSHIATLVVLANDSPHGVVAWEKSTYITTEPEGSDSSTMLHIVRQQGSQGHIRVSYVYVC